MPNNNPQPPGNNLESLFNWHQSSATEIFERIVKDGENLTERLTEVEAALAMTKSELTAPKSELTAANAELAVTKTKLTATQTELTATKVDLADLKVRLDFLEHNWRKLPCAKCTEITYNKVYCATCIKTELQSFAEKV